MGRERVRRGREREGGVRRGGREGGERGRSRERRVKRWGKGVAVIAKQKKSEGDEGRVERSRRREHTNSNSM